MTFLPAGSVLVASPELLDPNFMHSVVQICEHDEGGAFGLLLNRPTGTTVEELAPDHPGLGSFALPVLDGGPVGRERLQFLHRVPEVVGGGLEVFGRLHLGGDVSALASYLEQHGVEAPDVRMFLGSSGWAPGQLEGELEIGSWLVAPSADGWAFHEPAACAEGPNRERLWREVLRTIGPGAEGLGHLPPDVRWN